MEETIKTNPTPDAVRRAAEFRLRIVNQIKKGTFNYAKAFPQKNKADAVVNEVLTVRHLLEQYMKRKEEVFRRSTYKAMSNDVRILIDMWGQVPAYDLKRAQIYAYALAFKSSTKRLKNLLMPLRSSYKEACMLDPKLPNPFEKIVLPTKRREAAQILPFSSEEQGLILAATQCPVYRAFFQISIWTGLRTSEAVALNWADVDYKKGVLHITKALTGASEDFEGGKTQNARREVVLLKPSLEALDTLVRGKKDEPVFVRKNKRIVGSYAYKYWCKTLERAGVQHRKMYQVRHTFASMMLTAGENPNWIAAQMGHADLSMVSRVYAKWIPDKDSRGGCLAVEKYYVGDLRA